MKTTRRMCPVLGVAVSAAVLALAPGLPAQGAVSNGWRVVFTHHYGAPANQSVYQDVAAAGPPVPRNRAGLATI